MIINYILEKDYDNRKITLHRIGDVDKMVNTIKSAPLMLEALKKISSMDLMRITFLVMKI
jgi:hypothetical protein